MSLTLFVATHVSILASDRSTGPFPAGFIARLRPSERFTPEDEKNSEVETCFTERSATAQMTTASIQNAANATPSILTMIRLNPELRRVA